MKIRIISALVGIVILVGVLAIPNPVALIVACALLAAVAVWELLYNTGIIKRKSLVIVSMAFVALEIPVCCYAEWLRSLVPMDGALYTVLNYLPLLLLGLFVLALVIFATIPALAVSFESVQYAFLLTIYAGLGFGSIAMMRCIRNVGWWLVVLLLIIAWVSDTGAYFVGTFLGKHKMAPKISPKKSWEGFFGGWILSVACAVGFFILRAHTISQEGLFYSLYAFLPAVILLAPLSVVGDLLASVIKRKYGIKDFGNIMPGHGGVMDRFDSVVFIAPLLYLISVNISKIHWFIGYVFF